MRRKDRKVIFRVINAIALIAFVISVVYIYFVGFSFLAISSVIASLCCIGGPVVVAGESAPEMIFEFFEACLHAIIDAVIGIFEAIGNAFSSIG